MKLVKWGAISIGLFLLNLAPSILTGYFAVVSDFPTTITSYIIFVQLFVLSIFIFTAVKLKFIGRHSFLLKWSDWKAIAILFFFQWGMSFIFETLARMTSLSAEEVDLFASSIHPTPLAITFISSVLLSPLVEELIFRGILLDKVFSKSWLGVLITSIIFGSAHLPSSLFAALAYIVPGMLFAYTYVKTGRLSYTIVVHAINNLLAFIFLTL